MYIPLINQIATRSAKPDGTLTTEHSN